MSNKKKNYNKMYDSEVKVIAGEVHDDWYHVFTASGVEGFCMKKYIAIKA